MTTQGNRVKIIREGLNLSQTEMGKIFNTTKAYISQIETNKCNFSVPQMIKLLSDYNVNINYLLCGVGSPFLSAVNNSIKAKILKDIDKILANNGIS